MNEEMQVLARRAVACKRWRWMDGMRTQGGDRAQGRIDLGLEDSYSWDVDTSGYRLFDGATELPDLTDPATLGCLLALVREAWDDRGVYNVLRPSGIWMVFASDGNILAGSDTEAGALVAALYGAAP